MYSHIYILNSYLKFMSIYCDWLAVLQYPDSVLSDLGSLHTPNPLQLLTVQSAMREAMERHWYGRYLASLTVEDKKTKEEKKEADQKQPTKTPVCVEHTVQSTLSCLSLILAIQISGQPLCHA